MKWLAFMTILPNKTGFPVRLKALIKKTTYPALKGGVDFVNSRPRLRAFAINTAETLGLYKRLKTLNLRLSATTRPATISPQDLTPHALRIYNELVAASKNNDTGHS